MHNWSDGGKCSSSKNLPPLNFIPKNPTFLTRNSFELFKINRLPVIREEEGYGSENEAEFSHNFTGSNSFEKNIESQSGIFPNDSGIGSARSLLKSKESSSVTKLPPLVNINCLMNTEIKQKKLIWDTKFGKRLVNGKNEIENLNPPVVKDVCSESTKESHVKLKDFQSHKIILKRKYVTVQNDRNSGRGRKTLSDIHNNRKKSNINKTKQSSSKTTLNSEEKCVDNNFSQPVTKSENSIGTPQIELSRSVASNFSFSKNQHFLTECVQSILDGLPNQITCEHCNKSFTDVKELCQHKKDHERVKETCLLCNKVFFNPNDFIQHLLGHESVDRFSCKKCKKYFPNLRKYKKHCLDHHFKSTHITDNNIKPDAELKNWLPKFQCKICKIDFSSEKEYEAHRREHIRRNWLGAYLLCPTNMSAY